ncbi:MAG: hypothetical protein PVG92_02415 [Holophagae bacterium]|jgi:hypothetical protein
MTAGEIEFRRYRVGDELAILEAAYGGTTSDRSLDEWSWLYPGFPLPRAISLAVRGDEIVAVIGGRRVAFSDGDRLVPAVVVRERFCRLDDPGESASTARRLSEHFVAEMTAEDYAVLAFDSDLGVTDAVTRSSSMAVLRRDPAAAAAGRRLGYRVELARDWEPRLDELWIRARPAGVGSVVRDATYAVQWVAAHPWRRFQSFLIFPRFGGSAVAWLVLECRNGICRWADVLVDPRHPEAVALAARLSAGVAQQSSATDEEVVLAGNPEMIEALERAGFRRVEDRKIELSAVGLEWPPDLVLTAADFGDCLHEGETAW